MFEPADTRSIIVDASVLREAFVPEDAIHRDREVNALSQVLQPVTRGQPAAPVLLTGPSGAGKTTIATFAAQRLREAALDAAAVHVNCWQAHTAFKTLYEVLRGIGRGVDVHRQSTPRDELLAELADRQGQLVVVLDEVDQLDDPGLLYDLYQLRGVSMVLVTNEEQSLLQGLDDRLRSRLQTAETVTFDAYRSEQLVDILAARADHGLAPETIGDDHLRRIADAAGGDARVAISVLRNAARAADAAGADRITAEHVTAAIPDGRQAVRARTLDALRPRQRELYELLRETGEIAPGALYDRYVERVEAPRTKRTIRSWLQKLTQYNLVAASGNGPDRTYRPVDPPE